MHFWWGILRSSGQVLYISEVTKQRHREVVDQFPSLTKDITTTTYPLKGN